MLVVFHASCFPLQLREVGVKHRNRSNASLKVIEKNKEEIAELKKKLEDAPAASEPSSAAANELAARTEVRSYSSNELCSSSIQVGK